MEGFALDSSLRELNVEHNRLTRITGLDTCKMLTELNLAANALVSVEGLQGLDSLRVLQMCVDHAHTHTHTHTQHTCDRQYCSPDG